MYSFGVYFPGDSPTVPYAAYIITAHGTIQNSGLGEVGW